MQGRAENRTREFIAGKIQIQVDSLIEYIDPGIQFNRIYRPRYTV